MKKIVLMLLSILPVIGYGQTTHPGDWLVYHVLLGNLSINNNVARVPFLQANEINGSDEVSGYMFGEPNYAFAAAQYSNLRKCTSALDASTVGECWSTVEQSKAWFPSETFPNWSRKINIEDSVGNVGGWVMTKYAANQSIAGLESEIESKQAQLSGSGFVKINGTTISYDNSTYLTGYTESQTLNLSTNTLSISGGNSVNLSTLVSASPGNNNATAYSSGTTYNITTTPAKVDFGTTDPQVTIPAAGTYLIISNVRVDYSGLTNLAANTVTVKLRRTNNTAADLTNATGDFIVPPVTLLTATGGDCDVNAVLYTTSNSNDVIELWASRSASISVGNIVAGNAWIVAVRIF